MKLERELAALSIVLDKEDVIMLSDSILIFSKLGRTSVLRELIKTVFFSWFKIEIFTSNTPDYNYSFVEEYIREYDDYFRFIRKNYELNNTIAFKKQIYGLNIRFMESMAILIKNISKLRTIQRKALRLYLAIKLLQDSQIKPYAKSIYSKYRIENIVFFYDGSFESKSFLKYKNSNCKSTTFIHGYDLDKSNISKFRSYLNISSNYIVVDGLFHHNTILKNNLIHEKIYFSNYRQKNQRFNNPLFVNNHSIPYKIFFIFIEAPISNTYIDHLFSLLQISNEFTVKSNYKFIIKLHPSDSLKNFEKFLTSSNNCILISEENIDSLLQSYNPDFAIIANSSIYVDLLVRKIKPFQIPLKFNNSIVVSKIDTISNSEDLIDKLQKWNKLSTSKRLTHLNNELELFQGSKDTFMDLTRKFKPRD